MRPASFGAQSLANRFVTRYGVVRPAAVVTCGFVSMPALVIGPDFIATVHARLARQAAAALPLEIKKPPVDISAMEQAVQWHKQRTHDPGLVGLRGLLRQAVQRMESADPPGIIQTPQLTLTQTSMDLRRPRRRGARFDSRRR